jgi:tRNA G46 methylase TrmB
MSSRVPEGQLEARPEAVERTIERHRRATRCAPISPTQRAAFGQICDFLDHHAPKDSPWVLDAGCGTGASCEELASLHGLPVVGIDRSAHRLAKTPAPTSSRGPLQLLRLRADLPAIWRLLVESGRVAEHCYLLYPNPSPKPSMLNKRWHGHGCFTDILRTCRHLELRTNWLVYAQEFAHAASYCLGGSHEVELFEPGARPPISPFEAKYLQSGHALYRVHVRGRGGGALLED